MFDKPILVDKLDNLSEEESGSDSDESGKDQIQTNSEQSQE